MKQHWLHMFIRPIRAPFERKLAEKTVGTLTPIEKVIVGLLLAVCVGSLLVLLNRVNQAFLVKIPADGGSIKEGIIGFPRFVNPLLATSNVDTDASLLVYSGLVRATPAGEFVPDLAESFTISPDGLTYAFTLKEDLTFHDGTPLTTEDVAFTIAKAQDSALKSPKRASWEGINTIVLNDREIQFTLSQPYALFLGNATLGILPKHIWEKIEIDQFPFSGFNVEPIGSGPYRVTSVDRNDSGVPEKLSLRAFDNYALGRPHIPSVTLRFYSNENEAVDAYKRGTIKSLSSVSPELLDDLHIDHIEAVPLPRIFAVFFNQNQAPIFARLEVREALDMVLDKEAIIDSILAGYGSVIDSPIPPGLLEGATEGTKDEETETAADILENAGWERGLDGVWERNGTRLAFTLATSNTPELKKAAELVENRWEEFGAEVDLQIFESSILGQNVIRPRQYEAILFGEVVGRDLDLYAFWHSSQRNDPGLNIALYANITADDLLEKARTTADRTKRLGYYAAFEREILDDTPAVFLYAPDFIYILPEKIQGMQLGPITIPAERFLNVHEWHVETDYIWTFFEN